MTKAEIAIKVKNEVVAKNPALASEKFRRAMPKSQKMELVAKMLVRAAQIETIYG